MDDYRGTRYIGNRYNLSKYQHRRMGRGSLHHERPSKSSRDRKGMPKSKQQLVNFIKQESIDSMKEQVQYFMRVATNQNPSGGIYTPVVLAIQPTGVDSLLPNYGTLTDNQRKIYIDYINIYIICNENDLEVNDTKSNFLRHFLVEKDDETAATAQEVSDMFTSYATNQSVVEESLNAVIPRTDKIWKKKDSGWIHYDATRKDSLSTGVTVTDVPNFMYPFRKYKKTIRVKKEFQISDNGTLLNWHQPTVAVLFTGLLTAAPDCTIYYHMYYKVLA